MKVLFLTKYPIEGASSRYRVYQYLELLKSQGIDADVQSFFSSAGYKAVFGDGGSVRKLLATLAGLISRLGAVRTANAYDLVYMQRELLPFGPPVLERWLQRRGHKLIFDYDDALFIAKDSSVSAAASLLRDSSRITEIFSLVDGVVAGNDFLREQAAAHCDRVWTLEVAEDTERLTRRPVHHNNGTLTLGWLGSRSTEKYLRLIEAVLAAFHEKIPDSRLLVVGGGAFRMEGMPVQHQAWSLEREASLLHQFDIGLMPLPEELWSEGKCGGKARTYMAAGVPAVVQGIGYNRQLMREGETGFLVRSHDEWLTALLTLARSPQLRERIAAAARDEVEVRFAPQHIAGQLAAIIREVAAPG